MDKQGFEMTNNTNKLNKTSKLITTSRGQTYTKEEVIEYHMIKGEERKFFQNAKIQQLKEMKFKVNNAGYIWFPDGRPWNKPKYIWINFGLKAWASRKQKNAFYKYAANLKLDNKLDRFILKVVYNLFEWQKGFRIDWHEQVNVFKDWELKLLIVPNENHSNTILFPFSGMMDYIHWQTKHNVIDLNHSDIDDFYANPDLFLPNDRYLYKEKGV